MKTRYLFTVVFISLQVILEAQSLLSGDLVTEKIVRTPMDESILSSDYVGSPYLIDSFMIGKVVTSDHTVFKLPMRYNIFRDIIDVKYQGRDMQILASDIIDNIEIGNYTLTVGNYELDGKKFKSYLFVLDTGKISLLKKRSIKFEEWRPAKAQESAPKPAEFKESLDYYFLRTSSGRLKPFSKVKELPELFTGHRREVEEFIDKNKIKMKQEKLVDLVRFYNSL